MANTLGDISNGVIHEVISLAGGSNSIFYQDVEDIIRGFIGDFKVEVVNGTGKVEYISPVTEAVDSLMYAAYEEGGYVSLKFYPKKLDNSVGNVITLDSFVSQKQNILKSAYDNIMMGQPLTISQKNLLGSLPVPLLSYFNSLSRLSYVDPSAASNIKDLMIERIARFYGNLAYLNAIQRVSDFIYYNIGKISASVSGAEGSKDVLKHLDEFKENAKRLSDVVLLIKKSLYKDLKGSDKEFRELVRLADKKVFTELYKYQYATSYNFANRYR